MTKRWLLPVMACCLQLVGCGGSTVSSMVQTGPGRVAGQLVIETPTIELRLDGPDQTSPDITLTPRLPEDEFGIFRGAQRNPIRTLRYQVPTEPTNPGTPVAAGPGRYVLPFAFEQLPVGDYRIGFYDYEFPDFDSSGRFPDPIGPIISNALPAAISQAALEVPDARYVWPAFGADSGAASVEGKLLCSGNGAPPGVQLVMFPAVGTSAAAAGISAAWEHRGLVDAQFGRVFVRFDHIAPGKYVLPQWDSAPMRYYSPEDGTDGYALITACVLDLAANQHVTGFRGHEFNERFPPEVISPLGAVDPAYRGLLRATLQLDPADIDWSRDTLLVAEAEPATTEPNYRSWNYLEAGLFGTGQARFELSALRAGNYRLKLLQLGATNADPVLELAASAELVSVTKVAGEPQNGPQIYGAATWAPAL